MSTANAKATEALAKVIYDLTKAGTEPNKKRVAELAAADARKALNVSQYDRDSDLVSRNAALDSARIALRGAQRDLTRRKERLEAAVARAPMNGRVIFHNVFKGSDKNRSPIQVGETRMEGSELCMLLDTSHLVVTLWINEMDISHVQLKQHARITLPALPSVHLHGEVSEIAVTAQDKNMALSWLALRRSGEAFVNVVRITLAFTDLPDAVKEQIRVGFTANVDLELDATKPSLCVPWVLCRLRRRRVRIR